MIGKFIVNRVRDTILKKLLLSGNISNSLFIKNIRTAMSTNGTMVSIFRPEYYKHMQTNTTPHVWNRALISMDGDFHAMEDAIIYMQQTENDMIETTTAELNDIKYRINTIEMLTSETDSTSENIISLIPEYIDNDATKTTCKISSNTKIAYPGDLLDIFKHIITPSSITFTLGGAYESYTTLGNLNELVKPSNSEYKIMISANEATEQTLTFTFKLASQCDGIHIKGVPDGSYRITSSITKSPHVLYDEVMLMSDVGKFSEFTISFTMSSYDRIQAGKYIYTFILKNIIPFTAQYHDVGILTTTEMTTNLPVVNVGGSYTGSVIPQIAVDSGEFYDISFNSDTEISTLVTVDSGYYSSTLFNGLVTLTTLDTSVVGVSMIGPFSCCQQIGVDLYQTTMRVISGGTIIFGFAGYIIIDGIKYNVNLNETKTLQPGIYTLISTNVCNFINSNSTATYELYINHSYTRIIPNFVDNIIDYPPYVYTFITSNDVQYLAISTTSLLGVYGCTANYTSQVNALDAASLIKIQHYTQMDKDVVVRFILAKNSSLNNPRIIFRGGK